MITVLDVVYSRVYPFENLESPSSNQGAELSTRSRVAISIAPSRFNSNTGYKNDEFESMQALSHFSYDVTNGQYRAFVFIAFALPR